MSETTAIFEGGHMDGTVLVLERLSPVIEFPVLPTLSLAPGADTGRLVPERVRYRRTDRLSRWASFVYELDG